MSEALERVRGVLVRFMPEVVVVPLLESTARKLGFGPATFPAEDLESLLNEISYAARAHCPDARFTEMMLALAELFDPQGA